MKLLYQIDGCVKSKMVFCIVVCDFTNVHFPATVAVHVASIVTTVTAHVASSVTARVVAVPA